jgi:hypothetical protein
MTRIDPRLLEEPVKPKSVTPRPVRVSPLVKRNMFSSVLALASRQLQIVLRGETLKVHVTNDQVFDKLAKRIDALSFTIKHLPKQDNSKTNTIILRLTQQLNELKQAVLASKPAKFPDVQAVRVTNPQQEKFPLEKMLSAFQGVEGAIRELKETIPQPQEVHFPEMPTTMSMVEGKAIITAVEKLGKMPKTMTIAEGKAILAALEKVAEKVDELPKSFPEFPEPYNHVLVDNFPVQKYPNPVTNININPLRGFAKSTAVVLSTALTPLPSAPLDYRRSLIIYNNSSSVTIYIGGSNVTSASGFPVPAGTYSPPIDAGPKMIVYGRTAASTADVRVLEVSNENIGG